MKDPYLMLWKGRPAWESLSHTTSDRNYSHHKRLIKKEEKKKHLGVSTLESVQAE